MALISLASSSDAPGVTTTALGLGHIWPRPVVVVEADSGRATSFLPGYFRGERPHGAGILELAARLKEGPVTDEDLFSQVISIGSNKWVLPGFHSPVAAISATSAWPALAELFRGLESAGIDVIADLGRLAVNDARRPLFTRSDAALLMAVADLPSLYALRMRLDDFHSQFEQDSSPAALGLILRARKGRPGYSDRDVRSAIALPHLGTIPHDGDMASVYSAGEDGGRKLSKSAFQRTLVSLANTITNGITARRSELGERSTSQAFDESETRS
ncbi:hypothetical protein [Paenarthrobacter nicotinovorans]|uniref:hypothetical protein n=1 Tax=Paenarthrobacter nicotinovorans TaxID=29320 RepID=UPI0011A4B8A6|nr:hypothetical protein [Paenarthrobacter nicotinovorans]